MKGLMNMVLDLKKMLSVICAAAVALTGCSNMTNTLISQKNNDELKWWQKTNAYEIYVNSFQDSDGDGYGDLNGIKNRLDHLKSLGVGALWLTPVYASPMADNGYDVADYYSINPRYGTMEDMDALIAEADKKGIKIIMDLVFNHTSDQNEWFLSSRKSRDNEYSDWYIWRDPKEDGSEPNNWRSIFGGSAWTWCEERQQYYLHTFASAQPDLNWENPEVRQALFDIANFWIDKGAGGFRMDAIPYIKKPADLSDGPADDTEGRADIHKMTANTDGILDYLREFKNSVTEGKDVFTVGEANGVSPDQLKYWVGNDGVFDMIFEFNHMNLQYDGAEIWCKTVPWKLSDFKKAVSSSEEATASNGWYPIYFENHDQPRSINHFFPEGADPVLAGRAMGTLLLTLRGTPFIYQGEELGYTNVSWDSIDDYDDLSSHNQYDTALREGFSESEALGFVHQYSRDNARTPMQWDTEKEAGFTSGSPWLPVHEDYEKVNAATEDKDPASVLSWYKKMTAIRAENAVLLNGTYKELLPESEEIFAFERKCDDKRMVVLINFTGKEVTYDLSAPDIKGSGDPEILCSSYENIENAGSPSPGVLRPYEAVILK